MALLALWNPNIQFLKTDGSINAGGKIVVTDHNDAESIPANYSDADGTTLNSSPIVLDALGRATCYIDDGSTYDLYVKDANGATLWTVPEMTPGTETIVVSGGFSVSSNDRSVAVTISVDSDGVTNYDLSIQDEIDRATEAEKGLADSIEAENKRAEGAESALSKSIADETERAKEAEKGLADAIEAEKKRAEEAERTLSESISQETERAIEAEKASRTEIVAGDNITVEKTVGTDGQDVYTVSGEREDNLVDDVRVNGASVVTDKVANIDVPVAGTASPLMDGKASVGNSLKYAREDHVHPSDTSREDKANKTTVVLGTSDSKYPTDKAVAEFVNSSIATNTANYISNNGEPFTSVEQLNAYTGEVTNNDYAFVTGTDSEGNTYYDRYKATVSGETVTWALEYRLNNSSFTAAQWSAINSGITSALVDKIHTHSNKDVLDGITSSDVANWNSKQNRLTFDTAPTVGSNNPVTSDGIKTAINAKANGDNSVAIFDGYMRRMNESNGWRRLAYKQFNYTNTNINTVFRLYLFGSNNEHIGLGDLIVNIRFDNSGSAPSFVTCNLLTYKPLNTSVKVRVIGVAGNAVVELWFSPLNFSNLALTCLGNGFDVTSRTKDWTFERYISSTDPEPVEDIANNIYVFKGTVKRVQFGIDNPTSGNLVAMDKNGLVKDSGIRITSSDVAKWNGKQNSLTFDTEPTAGSNNPVTSGGIKTAIDTVNEKGITVKKISGEQVICFE